MTLEITMITSSLSGMIAKTITAPADRIKLLYQTTHNKQFTYTKGYTFASQLVREHGVATLWKGDSIQMARIIPYTALSYSIQKSLKAYYKGDRAHISTIDGFKVGAITGAISSSIVYPIDTLRCCIATEMTKTTSAIQIYQRIVRQNGIASLWRGNLVSLCGIIPYGSLAWGGFYASNKMLHEQILGEYIPDKENTMVRALSLFVSVSFAQTVVYPIDVWRRRIQNTQKSTIKIDNMQILRQIIKEKALFRGVSINWLKTPLTNALSFSIFMSLEKICNNL